MQLQAIQELRLRLGEPTRTDEGGSSGSGAPTPRRSRGLDDPSAQALQASLSRGLDGTLGIDVDLFEGHPTVAILVPGGPAERQGTLQPGDIILRINGTACATIAQVLAALTLTVTLTLTPTLTLNLTLTRTQTH